MVKISPPQRPYVVKAKLSGARSSSQGKTPKVSGTASVKEKFTYPPGQLIVVNRTEQLVRCYANGALVYTFECVLGWLFKQTPPGCRFKIEWRSPKHKSGIYGTPMHYALFFTLNGEAFHQYHGDTSPEAWKELQRQQWRRGSAGCVRLKKDDAIRLYNWAKDITTKVWIVDRPPEQGGCAGFADPRNWIGLTGGKGPYPY
jgi:hypothetical protein